LKFDHNYVEKVDGPNVKKGKNNLELAGRLRQDIRDFKKSSGASRPLNDLVRMPYEVGGSCFAFFYEVVRQ